MTSSGPSRKVCDTVDMRDGFCCLRCGKSMGAWPGGSRHHRRPRSHPWPGLHGPANLVDLCGSGTTGCHGWVHAHPAMAYRYGLLVHSWRDPEKVPVLSKRWGWVWLLDDGTARPLLPSEKDRWLLETGLKWSAEMLDPLVDSMATVTLGNGLSDSGRLTAVTEDPDGCVAVTLDGETDYRLEDYTRIDFDNQGKETL